MNIIDKIEKIYGQKIAVLRLAAEGLEIDGEHHKQWYLEEILRTLGFDVDNPDLEDSWKRGIAP